MGTNAIVKITLNFMNFFENYRADLIATLNTLDIAGIEKAVAIFAEARATGKTIFLGGNGGSAASASHFVCDMVKGASFGRESRFRIISLNENIGTLTAYSNDVGYDVIFTEQLKNFAKPGDVFMAISGSGNSPNVVKAMEYANEIGCQTIGLSGRSGGKLAELAQLNIHVPNQHMGRIEDVHMMTCHMIAYYFMETAAG